MRLTSLKRHWERLGRLDPFWAALTDDEKRDRRWDPELFFRSGREEMAAVLQRAEQLGLTVSRRRALDFGSGAGRLTQALAAHFERTDGVDISASMLAMAARHNRFPDRCVYHRNTAPDLSLFPDATFSFIYSTLVLQHMEERYSRPYIGELLRVLEPGGLLVFQLPSHRGTTEPSSVALRTRVPGRLSASAFSAHVVANSETLTGSATEPSDLHADVLAARAGELLTLRVAVENRSSSSWPSLPDNGGRFGLNVANHWLCEDGTMLKRDDGRTPLPHDVARGERVEVMLGVRAPEWNGNYWIEVDLVQENTGWFAEYGSPTARVACRVTAGLPSIPVATSREESEPTLLFRDRHPRIFRVLLVTGLRDAYWIYRRAVDRIKAGRDRLIVGARHAAYDPVIPPLINWWRNRPFAPRMEMHCLPRTEVLAIVQKHGGRMVDVEEEMMPGGFQSCRYWVCKT